MALPRIIRQDYIRHYITVSTEAAYAMILPQLKLEHELFLLFPIMSFDTLAI